jgi:hypothetical protein
MVGWPAVEVEPSSEALELPAEPVLRLAAKRPIDSRPARELDRAGGEATAYHNSPAISMTERG